MQRRSRFVCRPLALAAMLAVQMPVPAQAQPEVKPLAIEIPAQPAAEALQAFIRQYNFQLLYAPDLLKGLSTRPVSGTMSAREALARMLEGSGLQIVDTGPNAATLRPSGATGARPPASGASQAALAETPDTATLAAVALSAADGPRLRYDLPAGDALDAVRQLAQLSGAKIRFNESDLKGVRTNAIRGELTLQQAMQRLLADTNLWFGIGVANGEIQVHRMATIAKVEVTGSHLRSLVKEQSTNPVLVLTRAEIDRAGITTMADLRNLIPQLSVGAAASFNGNSAGSAPDGRVLFDLHGMGAGNTLILVDGLRLPRTGSRTVAEAYEATGIPMSAIERVEVLMGGGSAIYGADAVGGVVNFITRKNYRGSEIEYARDNTFNTDAANDRLSFSHALRAGKLTARGMLSIETQNPLARRDRAWLASDDRRPYGGTDKTASNTPLGGMVKAVSGVLPGIGAATAYIPTGSDGKNLTIADYANAPATERYDPGKTLNAINAYERRVANAFAEYEFSDWAQVYANFTWSTNDSEGVGDPVSLSNYKVAAGYPGNPFGVPIYVSKYFWELGQPVRHYTFTQRSLATGLRGDLPKGWRYDLSFSDARSNPALPDGIFQFDTTALTKAITAGALPVLLHDSLSLAGQPAKAPNAAGTLESYYYKDGRWDEPETKSYTLALDGPLWQLDAGPINLAFGAERRTSSVKLTSDQNTSLTEAVQPKEDRVLTAQYIELSLPLLSPKSSLQIPLVHSLTVTGALRRDDYSDFGSATTPLTGLLYKPTSWLSFRGSHNKAFKVPTLFDLTRQRYTSTTTIPATGSSALYDPYRKNEQYIGTLKATFGGNPNLKPERSTHDNYGVILESPFELTRGFSMSLDRWSSDILDRVGSLPNQERMAYFPETYTRDALTAEDAAAGYQAGKITAVDTSSMNIARFRSAGWDLSLMFQRRFPIGEFMMTVKQTRTDRYEAYATPGAAASKYTTPVLRPTRTVGMFSWSNRGAGASMTVIHQNGFPVSLATTPVVNYPDTLEHNFNFWYDFGVGSLHDKSGFMGQLLADTRVSFGLINAFNKAPPLSPTGDVNSAMDPRMRRYTFTLRKRF